MTSVGVVDFIDPFVPKISIDLKVRLFLLQRVNNVNSNSEIAAALVIQRWWRNLRRIHRLRLETIAALLIQRVWRGHRARACIHVIVSHRSASLTRRHYDALITSIQALWRGYRLRTSRDPLSSMGHRRSVIISSSARGTALSHAVEQLNYENACVDFATERAERIAYLEQLSLKLHAMSATTAIRSVFTGKLDARLESVYNALCAGALSTDTLTQLPLPDADKFAVLLQVVGELDQLSTAAQQHLLVARATRAHAVVAGHRALRASVGVPAALRATSPWRSPRSSRTLPHPPHPSPRVHSLAQAPPALSRAPRTSPHIAWCNRLDGHAALCATRSPSPSPPPPPPAPPSACSAESESASLRVGVAAAAAAAAGGCVPHATCEKAAALRPPPPPPPPPPSLSVSARRRASVIAYSDMADMTALPAVAAPVSPTPASPRQSLTSLTSLTARARAAPVPPVMQGHSTAATAATAAIAATASAPVPAATHATHVHPHTEALAPAPCCLPCRHTGTDTAIVSSTHTHTHMHVVASVDVDGTTHLTPHPPRAQALLGRQRGRQRQPTSTSAHTHAHTRTHAHAGCSSPLRTVSTAAHQCALSALPTASSTSYSTPPLCLACSMPRSTCSTCATPPFGPRCATPTSLLGLSLSARAIGAVFAGCPFDPHAQVISGYHPPPPPPPPDSVSSAAACLDAHGARSARPCHGCHSSAGGATWPPAHGPCVDLLLQRYVQLPPHAHAHARVPAEHPIPLDVAALCAPLPRPQALSSLADADVLRLMRVSKRAAARTRACAAQHLAVAAARCTWPAVTPSPAELVRTVRELSGDQGDAASEEEVLRVVVVGDEAAAGAVVYQYARTQQVPGALEPVLVPVDFPHRSACHRAQRPHASTTTTTPPTTPPNLTNMSRASASPAQPVSTAATPLVPSSPSSLTGHRAAAVFSVSAARVFPLPGAAQDVSLTPALVGVPVSPCRHMHMHSLAPAPSAAVAQMAAVEVIECGWDRFTLEALPSAQDAVLRFAVHEDTHGRGPALLVGTQLAPQLYRVCLAAVPPPLQPLAHLALAALYGEASSRARDTARALEEAHARPLPPLHLLRAVLDGCPLDAPQQQLFAHEHEHAHATETLPLPGTHRVFACILPLQAVTQLMQDPTQCFLAATSVTAGPSSSSLARACAPPEDTEDATAHTPAPSPLPLPRAQKWPRTLPPGLALLAAKEADAGAEMGADAGGVLDARAGEGEEGVHIALRVCFGAVEPGCAFARAHVTHIAVKVVARPCLGSLPSPPSCVPPAVLPLPPLSCPLSPAMVAALSLHGDLLSLALDAPMAAAGVAGVASVGSLKGCLEDALSLP